MPQTISKGTPDRSKTDQNLHAERRNADQVLAEQKATVEAEADRVVDRAREHADAVLHEAREKADEKLEAVRPAAVVRAVIEEERQHEDRAVEHERAKADESLQQEREQNARDLLALLPQERKSTDRSLHTERVRADDAVAHRDDVLGIVSHDLRDLLGGIVTTAAMLLRSAPLGEAGTPARTGAELIQRHAARMKRLIDDLTDVTSIDAGKLAVTPKPGNLAPLVSEAVISLRGAATSKNISLALPQPEVPMPAIFDADRVLQVLINLVANAIKFTPAGGQISVVCEHVDETMRVSVTDTGPGIAPEFLEAIFERYRQAAVADRRGLGLGLYIARKIIEAHHGKIWAQSEPGKGTTMTFTLPSPG
jgi:signal transduction histidine kinase